MSFWRNYYHITWSTKNRLPLIRTEFEGQLFNYIVKKAAELEVFVFALNGTQDHIHIVVSIPPKHSVAEVVKLLKGASAHYINHNIQTMDQFAWQRGYGCLSIGEKQRPIAEEYVRNQKSHHARETFIGWLEQSIDKDDGPKNVIDSGEAFRKIKEIPASYTLTGDSPF